jgi:hypothetical protein
LIFKSLLGDLLLSNPGGMSALNAPLMGTADYSFPAAGDTYGAAAAAAGKPAQKYDYVIVCTRHSDAGKGESHSSGLCSCCGSGEPMSDDTGRRRIEEDLRASGLLFNTIVSRDGKEYFIRIRAEQERLEHHAEYMKLMIPTRIDDGPTLEEQVEMYGDETPFISRATDPKRRALFPNSFTSLQRQIIILDILQERPLPYPGRYPGYGLLQLRLFCMFSKR